MNPEIIVTQLQHIETRERVRIFYACESGSRAWGFPSADSDYDVRFLYAHPPAWYLSIQTRRDVLEFPVEGSLDINGWDIRKALQLLHRSNPPLLEWLGSPIVYVDECSVAARMREFAARHFSPVSCAHHYLHMARSNYRAIAGKEDVSAKQYLYVLRPILAIEWLGRGFGLAPTEFGALVDRIVESPLLREEIERLVEAKRRGAEGDRSGRVAALDEFLSSELDKHGVSPFGNESSMRAQGRAPIDELDELFRAVLQDVWP
jgi:predicted nucleotidyltransferase